MNSGVKIAVRILATLMGLFGAVVAGFAGLCTYAFAGGADWSNGGASTLLVIGGVPIVFGLAMIVGAVFLWRITLKPDQ